MSLLARHKHQYGKRYCSFCEKESVYVDQMWIGTYGHICNECVDKFHAEARQPAPAPQAGRE